MGESPSAHAPGDFAAKGRPGAGPFLLPGGWVRRADGQPIFWYFDAGAPQMGHFSGTVPNSMSPQTGHR